MREIVERSLGSQTFNTVSLGGLAGLALLLAVALRPALRAARIEPSRALRAD
jgi:hypothetical protein